ncbi:MAG: GWxTD domain-containing protein [bacterium]|nr:GWxTD domain-containing protein [bacterium]
MPKEQKAGSPSDKYRQWLDLVSYIITKDEKATFFKLTNDRDREVFISLFWNLRDPSPGTERNEFKEEHFRRIQYADKYFGRITPKKGRRTDMGRIYIILGEPDSKDKYDVDNLVVPTQIWSYYGKKRPGLPASFWVVFWKKDNVGEYKLYDPASDGPHSLLRPTRETTAVDPTNTAANYEIILNAHPSLAKASLTLLPDDMPYDFNPSLRSQLLLQKIIELPVRKINDTYATNFLKYKGKVDVDYSLNYIESRHKVTVTKDPETGLAFVHFAVRPKRVSAQFDEENNSYSLDFDLVVALNKVRKGETETQAILEYRKHFPFTGDRETVVKNFANSIIISDCFPVPVGDYRLSVLLQNRVNKEFTYFDADISVKAGAPGPVISGLLLVKEVKRLYRRVFLPFKYGDMETAPEPGGMFGTGDEVFVVFNLGAAPPAQNNKNFTDSITKALKGVIEVRDYFGEGKYLKEYPFEVGTAKGFQTVSRRLESMKPGYYRVTVRLFAAGGKPLIEKMEKLTVSVAEHTPRTTNISRAVPYEHRFLYYHVLGLQYMRSNNLEKAETLLEKAFKLRPQYPKLVVDLCGLLLVRKRFGRTAEVVEHLKGLEKYRFHYFALRGKMFYGRGLYSEAVESLTEANRVYDSDVSVLNVLGFSYLKTGNKKEAQKVFTASLKLNGRQEHILRALRELN